MPRYKLVLEYDGTEYVGWQAQANGAAIQPALERALSELLGESVTVVGAGRTDSGVHARGQVASLVNADPKVIVWTSGATESNNLALKGAAYFYQGKGKHIVTVMTEHKAVLDTVRELERQGFSATFLAPESNGLVDLGKFEAALRPDTIIASVMLENNEIGVIQDIASLGEICRKRRVLFHVDDKDSTDFTNIKGIADELAKNYGIKNYDPVAKFKEQFSFLRNPVISNLSGEYLAFEELSEGRYHVKLWHLRSGAVFEVPLGLTLNAPVTKNPTVPIDPKR